MSQEGESKEHFNKSLKRLLQEIRDAELRHDYNSVDGFRQTVVGAQKLARKLYPDNDILKNLSDEPLAVFGRSTGTPYTSSGLIAIRMRVLQIADAIDLDLIELDKIGINEKFGLDAYSPHEIARRIESVGVVKAKLDFFSTSTLAILAGAFISLGGIYFTLATTQITANFAFTQILGGLAFSLGLILVVVAGAELFTGNNLIVMAFASRKISFVRLVRNWSIVYVGNFLGSLLTAAILYFTNIWATNNYQFGIRAIMIANNKVNLDFVHAFSLGILCNTLVCLAVWLAMGGRSVTDKILAIIFPISAFVAVGFEHSVANMYFIPFAMMIKGDPNLTSAIHNSGKVIDLSNLTLVGLFNNLLPVSLGNIVGGSIFVGFVYWLIYLRGSNHK